MSTKLLYNLIPTQPLRSKGMGEVDTEKLS